jgi:hypothetical protein
MADYNEALSKLHQRVVQDELGLLATIDERGCVQVKHPDLGEVEIFLSDSRPEYMDIHCAIFTDYDREQDDLMRICNVVNGMRIPKLNVSTGNTVYAGVTLLVAAPGIMPDEALLRGVIGWAIGEIKGAAEEFAAELQKLQ